MLTSAGGDKYVMVRVEVTSGQASGQMWWRLSQS